MFASQHMVQLVRRAATPHPQKSPFDAFVYYLDDWHKTTLASNKRAKGDVWESFCKRYLDIIMSEQYEDTWLLRDTPSELLEHLKMYNGRKDMGIDMIARRRDGGYVAVQCKYKQPHKDGYIPKTKRRMRYNRVNWGELKTFQELCASTGPWHSILVMTNGKNIVWTYDNLGTVDRCELTYKNFINLTTIDMCRIAGEVANLNI